MIVTVTPNPALDQTMFVDEFAPGDVNRARETHLDPAGKGINASRIAHRLGWPTIAFGFLAGETGRIVEEALDGEGVQHHFVKVPGRTRVNVTVVTEDREATSVYGPGPEVEAWSVVPPQVEPRSTVGSGDSFVAGLAVALARGEEMEAGLRLATAAGAATAASSGTSLGTAEVVWKLLPAVRVVRL